MAGHFSSIWLLPASAAALVAALWSAQLNQINTEHRIARTESVAHSQTLARVFAEHVAQVLRQTDHATQLFKVKYEERQGDYRLDEFTAPKGLLDSVMPGMALQMALYDREGIWRESANAIVPEDVANLPFFKALSQGGSEAPVFATPTVDPRTNKWQILVARRLNQVDGGFNGVFVIMFDPTFFVDDYQRLGLDGSGAIVLSSRSGGLSVGRIGTQTFARDQLGFSPASQPGHVAGEIRVDPALDAIPRIYSAAQVGDFSLVALIGLGEQHAMAGFERVRANAIRNAILTTLLIAGVTGLLMRQSRTLRTSQAQLLAMTHASPLGLIRTDLHGNCTYVNRRFEAITGLDPAAAAGHGWHAVIGDYNLATMDALFEHQRHQGEPFQRTLRCRNAAGRDLWIALKFAAVKVGGRIEGFVGSVDDITELREAEFALRANEARLRTMADAIPAMVAYVDDGCVYRFHNRAYALNFGADQTRILGATLRDREGETRYATLQPYVAHALLGETVVFEEQFELDGAPCYHEVTFIPQTDEQHGPVVGFHIMRRDVTQQKHEEQRLIKLAQVDALTGLANRAGFTDKLARSMQDAIRSRRLMALFFLDIDRFKPVNDTHGHDVGDALLKAFARRLTGVLRASDTVARLGGDEFTIILESLHSPEDAAATAHKIVLAMRTPFELGSVTVSVSTSVGVAYFQGGAFDPDALLKQADLRLYEAKRAGRDTFRAGDVVLT